jgi:hypothetical protein
MKVLYLTYENVFRTGILQAQVISPLKKINKLYGVDFTVTSIVKAEDSLDNVYIENKSKTLDSPNAPQIVEFNKTLGKNQSLFAFVYDIYHIFIGIYKLAKSADIIHARGYGGAFLALLIKIFLRKKFIFDMRGVLPEETVYVGKIKINSLKFKLMKWLERILLKYSSYIFVVSEPFKKYIENFKYNTPIYNISNPADFSLYQPEVKEWKKIRILYSGSLQNWHCADDTYKYFKRIKNDFTDSVELIVCANDLDGHKALLAKNGLQDNEFNIVKAPFNEMPAIISTCHIGFCLTKQTFLTSVCLPVKFGEYIAGNLSVISNERIGDIPYILNKHNAGLTLESPIYNENEYKKIKVLITDMLERKKVKYNNANVPELNWDSTIGSLYNNYLRILDEN